jgi:hypothetical protein
MAPILRSKDIIGFLLCKVPSLFIQGGEGVIDKVLVILLVFSFLFIHPSILLSHLYLDHSLY